MYDTIVTMKRIVLSLVFLSAALSLFCEFAPDFEVKDRILVKYRGSDKNIVIPGNLGINRIGKKAFAGESIVSIKIPVGVDAIDSQAFANCSFLKTISLPNTLTLIAYRAFFNCSAIRELDMPDSLKSIGPRAFSGCFALGKLSISRRTKVGEHAFMGMPAKPTYKD
jgi:hypothetical protein